MYGTYPSGDSPQARFNGQNKGGYVPYIPLGMLLIDRPLGAESARVCTVHTPQKTPRKHASTTKTKGGMYGTYPPGKHFIGRPLDAKSARVCTVHTPQKTPRKHASTTKTKGGMYGTYPPGMLLIGRPLGAESARVCTVHTPSSLNSHSNKRSRKSASFRSLDADKPPALIRTEIAPLASLSNEATTFPFTLNTLGGS